MDSQYSWKRTEEIEIDLADLVRRFCTQWKLAAVCALASALILGGYGLLKGRDRPDVEMLEETEMTEIEEKNVADAVQLENEISGLEKYLDNSVLMQLDPYHKSKYVMLYCIDHAKSQELPVITESYLNFILNGGVIDELIKFNASWNMDKSCLAELISAYQKIYNSPYQVVVDDLQDSGMMAESLFYVEITGSDAGMAEKMARDIQDVLAEYSAGLKETAGRHRLMLVSSIEKMTADSGLQTQQHEKKALLSTNRMSLKAMTDAFSKKQMDAYKEAIGAENEQNEIEIQEENSSDENSGFSIKLIFLGFVGGIFAYGCIFSCWYFFSDTVKSIEEMRRIYTFPVYGRILLERKGVKRGEPVSGMQQDDNEYGKAHVLNRIRLACQKQGITRLYAVSDFLLTELEKECLESIVMQLKSWEIEMAVAENAIMDTGVWDDMAETGNVLMVCRMDTTTHRMIDNAMHFYLENGMAVTGAAVFSKMDKTRYDCGGLKAAQAGKGL